MEKTKSELIDELLNLSIGDQHQRLREFYESHDAIKVMLALEIMTNKTIERWKQDDIDTTTTVIVAAFVM